MDTARRPQVMRTFSLAFFCLLVGCAGGGAGSDADSGTSPAPDSDVDAGATPEAGQMRITVGPAAFLATLEDNPTAQAFTGLLPLTLNMTDVKREREVLPVLGQPACNRVQSRHHHPCRRRDAVRVERPGPLLRDVLHVLQLHAHRQDRRCVGARRGVGGGKCHRHVCAVNRPGWHWQRFAVPRARTNSDGL